MYGTVRPGAHPVQSSDAPRGVGPAQSVVPDPADVSDGIERVLQGLVPGQLQLDGGRPRGSRQLWRGPSEPPGSFR